MEICRTFMHFAMISWSFIGFPGAKLWELQGISLKRCKNMSGGRHYILCSYFVRWLGMIWVMTPFATYKMKINMISNIVYRGLFVFSKLTWEVVVRFVNTGRIVRPSLFKLSFYYNDKWVGVFLAVMFSYCDRWR